MARIREPTPEQKTEWNAWVASRPACVRKVAKRFDPWSLYRMKSTGHRVTLYSFGEAEDGNVTLTIVVSAEFNMLAFERRVFGIDPDDLEPSDLPAVDEPCGAILSQDEVNDNLDVLRVLTRPDLFQMGDDGKAVRKQ
jgi:hypothetical protein